MRQKRKAKSEFRYNFDTKHMTYVFEEDKNRLHSVGITHDKKTFGKKNMPLENNPQKNHNEKAYIRNGIINKKKSSYSKKINKNFRFSKKDFPKVKSKIRNYKKHR